MSCAKTNKDIFETFSPSVSQAILVFPCQTGWRYSDGNPSNGSVECKGYEKITICDLYRAILDWCLQYMHRVTLIGVFLGHFRINLHQTRTQYSTVMRDRNTGTQPNFPKSLSKSLILSLKNSCSHFFSRRSHCSQQVCSYVQTQ